MATLRSALAALMSKGVLSRGWYSILTGLALLYVAYALGSVADEDTTTLVVAVVLALAGAWQLERGLRTEFRRGTKSIDPDS